MWYPDTPQYPYKKPLPAPPTEFTPQLLHLAKQDITDLLTVTLNNMYFSFNGQVFRQKECLHMGSNISGILAILFMADWKPSPSHHTYI